MVAPPSSVIIKCLWEVFVLGVWSGVLVVCVCRVSVGVGGLTLTRNYNKNILVNLCLKKKRRMPKPNGFNPRFRVWSFYIRVKPLFPFFLKNVSLLTLIVYLKKETQSQ